jgi:hypothetical protein
MGWGGEDGISSFFAKKHTQEGSNRAGLMAEGGALGNEGRHTEQQPSNLVEQGERIIER